VPRIMRMPAIAANSTEAVLSAWSVAEGVAFAAGDPLVEVEMEKAIVDVPAEAAGVLLRRLAHEGATIEVGAPIALLGEPDEAVVDVDGALAALGLADRLAGGSASAGAVVSAATGGEGQPPIDLAPSSPEGPDGSSRIGHPKRLFASPAARAAARSAGVELARVTGTGPGGRVRRRDVEAAAATLMSARTAPEARPAPTAAAPAASPPPEGGAAIAFPPGADEVLVPMSQMRKGIAAQMTRALAAPHAYLQVEVDVTRLVALREREKRAYQAKEGIGLSYVPFVVKASAEALKRHPNFNAHWTDQGLLAKRRVSIGVAVAMDEGLIVPVVRDADQLSIHGLNAAIADIAARARANRLRLDDFGGGTFTVDNTGYLGTNLVMPVLNVPEVGIVTMEAITKRPVVVSTPDGDVIAIRPVMNMVLGIDHRANDGAAGAALLRDIKAWLEAVGPETSIY
jgi:pyruvate/2-oxoglutarate dehydrogenase complex dihydrolipoamide acyltransferase (E2) component